MPCQQTIYGKIIYGPEAEVIEGYILVEDGIIKEVEEKRNDSGHIIAPCFVNAHTHIGDSIYKDPVLGKVRGHYVERDLSQLVQPPHGLKHRILARTSHKKMVQAMKNSLMDMNNTGTYAFADFREGGIKGVIALKEALESSDINAKIFGRPGNCKEKRDISEELEELLINSDGLGMSGANDMDITILETARQHSLKRNKTFAIHAGESSRDDIEKALTFDPDILIHMTKATNQDLRGVADMDIPVVVCPRSNFITGVGMAPIIEMLDNGIKVAVGTDNVMLNSVNMFAEMELLSKIFGIDDRQVFMMCTLMGAAILGLETTGSILEGNIAKIMIINGNSNNLTGIKDPISGIVRRGRPDDILSVII
ncbi:amidohydrolase family protein [Methanolobus psychrotolerans]|uniref:amidohydrolase family protein n=1 Tax=Methanolobus psychrotolerans TaxID=1874706 RepID=UPI000B919356|nr:amidohydrolase family protein [Methanolobus psychrotolerans]